jgi:tryptophan-rich sensory protein
MEKKIPLTLLRMLASVLVCQLAGFVGSLFTTPNIPLWYATIQKPSFTPPDSVFGPVWITLYLLMGIAAFLVWNKGIRSEGVDIALGIFIVQLLFNVLWSIAFFGFHSPLLGLVVIVILWVTILLSIIKFWKITLIAGILMIPYILWVSFAAVLNFSIFMLNR